MRVAKMADTVFEDREAGAESVEGNTTTISQKRQHRVFLSIWETAQFAEDM